MRWHQPLTDSLLIGENEPRHPFLEIEHGELAIILTPSYLRFKPSKKWNRRMKTTRTFRSICFQYIHFLRIRLIVTEWGGLNSR